MVMVVVKDGESGASDERGGRLSMVVSSLLVWFSRFAVSICTYRVHTMPNIYNLPCRRDYFAEFEVNRVDERKMRNGNFQF